MEEIAITNTMGSNNLTVWQLFIQADIVVKFVMLSLLAASVWCWTIIFSKYKKIMILQRAADNFEEIFWTGESINSLYERCKNGIVDPMGNIFVAAMREWKSCKSKPKDSGLRISMQQRIERMMYLQMNKEMERIEKNLGFLASTGSTAPFVGLFGTVWGIMNSFKSIAASQSTNLAVVAPGIAEALFATAIGLIAAIPAVLAYNKLSADINAYENRLTAFVAEFSTIISKQLEKEEGEAA